MNNIIDNIMDSAWHRCNILYYFHERYYGKVCKIAKHALSIYPDQFEFIFYNGIAETLQGQIHRGIPILTPLLQEKDIQLAVIIALIYAHKSGTSIDRESLHNLETKLKEERKISNAISFYYAGLFLSLAGKYEKAAEYITKSMKKDSNNLNTILLKGWNDMYKNIGEMQLSVLDCFELALSKSDKNLESLLGLAQFKYFVKDHNESNLLVDKLIVNYPGQVVPLIVKLKNEIATRKWDTVYENLERIFLIEPDNLDALQIRIFIALGKNSDYIEAADQLNKFFAILESEETHNGFKFLDVAQIFSRICGRSSTVLSQAYRFAQYASETYPNNVNYLSEIGYQCYLQGKNKDANSFFKAASKIDSNSIIALCGLTLCQMAETGPTEQISQQVELLFEMQGVDKLSLLYLLSSWLSNKDPVKAMSFLNEAGNINISAANQYPYSLPYIKALDPDFILEVFKESKKYLPKKPFVITGNLIYSEEDTNSYVNLCFRLLNIISKACPGLIVALYELAKIKFQFGYVNEAKSIANQISELDNTHAGCHMLIAQIYIQKQSFAKAAQSLEICLSYNFKIRDSAMYHFLNGVILKNANQLQDALSSFTTSLAISNNKSNTSNVNRSFDSNLNITDKATLYLQIIELRTTLGQHTEVGKIMQEAIQELSYTPEEGRLVMAKADLALSKGDVDNAIDMLNEIKPGQPYFLQVHTKMAHTYLKEKNDRTMFTNCFKNIIAHHPMADSHVMMGDAYMSIYEPSLAVESYESAFKENPKNMQLVQKLGKAFVKTHQFGKATKHYENSIKCLDDDDLKFEYIELLVKLKQYEKADATISTELATPRNKEKDIGTFRRRVRYLLLQAKAREKKNSTVGNTAIILTEAKELQTSIVKRVEIDSRGDLQEEKQQLALILCSLAKAKSHKEPGVAANLYAEALIYIPRDPNTLLALAKLYAQVNNAEKCEQTCALLLNTDPNNESAAVMMADLAFRKTDFDTAQSHLSQILSIKPTSWEALSQLIEIQWRRGKLSEADKTVEAAKQAMGNQEDPGYWYCSGLYALYDGRPNTALRLFNQCRRTERWGHEGARRMVLLCLNQDTPDALNDTFMQATDEGDTKLLAIRTAEKLLVEVAPQERKPLQALVQLATKQKTQADRVLQEILPLATDDSYQDDPYLILAIAMAYNILKQPTRAKNALKRTVSYIQWTPEKADGLERCWLEVADGQITSSRLDAARELLTKIITHNASCAMAYQYLGYLSEKEQNYKMAAQNYGNAWLHSGKTNLGVGYKLAHAYLKLKKYPECIIVCRHILKVHPDYPKIKKEILDKAKSNLRT